ncbi:MAG: hypothetical protein KTR35_11195 [Gammaproteobacteria bacterium]|nr:hypothetical protein [Gammaproteobacteria bacterium]
MKKYKLRALIVAVAFAATICSARATWAQVKAESWGPVATMQDPGENWFLSYGSGATRIFNAAAGEMLGLVHYSEYTPAIQPHFGRKEFYTTNIFYSRNTYGERTDRFIIHDFENLAPVAEIEIPQKSMINGNPNYIGLMSGENHVVSMNMTPAQSVTVVDVEKRQFVGEISIAGCALILPVEDNAFLTICGDGSVMLVGLDEQGKEAYRVRSDKFFDVQTDPVYDVPEPTADGWLLMTFGGVVFEISVDDKVIEIGEPWSLIDEEERLEEGWWPGGGQLVAIHKDLGLLYVLMHPAGDINTQYDSGNFIWIFNIETELQIGEIELLIPAENMMVTQEDEPLLIVGNDEGQTLVYDALKFTLQRSIPDASGSSFVDF